MEREIKIRDLRKKNQYKIDDAYLNGYAKLCGVYATAVYNSLSRHADFHTQESFPSIDLIAEQHGIDRKSVIKGIKALEKYNIIEKRKEKDVKTRRQMNNVYVLMDKSNWLPKDSIRVDGKDAENRKAESFSRTEPSPSQGESRVDEKDCKDNTVKDNTIKVYAAKAAPWDLEKEIEKVQTDKKEHIRIIGLYIEAKNYRPENAQQIQSIIKRNVRAAMLLKGYDWKRLVGTMAALRKKADFAWKLETVGKFIDDPREIDKLPNVKNKNL